MHVLEIIGIKELSKLTERGSLKPKTEAVIHDTNIRVEEIQKKLDEIIEAVEMSNRRTSRFPYIKVCRDWGTVLFSVNELKNLMDSGKEIFGFNNWLIGKFDNNVRTAYYFFDILKRYCEYFSRDRFFHDFYKILGCQLFSEYNTPFVMYIPLYILYFAMTIHRKFLTTVLNSHTYNIFINVSVSETGQIIENKGRNEITGGNCSSYLLKQNDEIIRYIKNILILIKKKNVMDTENNYFKVFTETINILYEIYSSHADYLPEAMNRIFESINSINDLYEKMSLGEPHFYYITKEKIDKLYNIKEGLEQQLDILERRDI
jgi:hypothetical protein